MKKALAAAGLGAALTLGSLLGAGTASAYTSNEANFLNAMAASGGYIYDPGLLVDSGWSICNAFSYENGNEIAVDVFRNSSWADIPNLHEAQRWVQTAANNLCPWVWNNGSTRAIF